LLNWKRNRNVKRHKYSSESVDMLGFLFRKKQSLRNPSHLDISRRLAPLVATAIEQIIDSHGIDFLINGCFCVTDSAEIEFASGPVTAEVFSALKTEYLAVATIKSRREASLLATTFSKPNLEAYRRVEVDQLSVAISDTLATGVMDRLR
jgi:hypothetical protein